MQAYCARCGAPIQSASSQTPQGWMHVECAQQAFAPGAGAMPPGYGYAPQMLAANPDVLPGWWIALLYGSLLVPCAWPVVSIVARAMYWEWQSQYPVKAATLRKHRMISALIFVGTWGILILIWRLSVS